MAASFQQLVDWATTPHRAVGRAMDALFFVLIAAACFLMAYLSWQHLVQSPQFQACEAKQSLPVARFVAKFWWLYIAAGAGWLVIGAHAARSGAFSRLLSLALMLVGLAMALTALPLLSAVGPELEQCAAGS